MNFFAKCLIFFLNVLISAKALAVSEGISHLAAIKPDAAPKKRAKMVRQGPASSIAMRVLASWQIVSSAGKGGTMGTTAESYAAEAILNQTALEQWQLKIGPVAIPVSVFFSNSVGDAVVVAERGDLLKVFSIELSEEDRLLLADGSVQASSSMLTEGLQLTVPRTLPRQMETIYRSPGDGLFLVKASLGSLGHP